MMDNKFILITIFHHTYPLHLTRSSLQNTLKYHVVALMFLLFPMAKKAKGTGCGTFTLVEWGSAPYSVLPKSQNV